MANRDQKDRWRRDERKERYLRLKERAAEKEAYVRISQLIKDLF